MKRITKIEAAKDSGRRKLRVAVYARVSTDSNEQLASLESQKNHYERYIKARPDWEYAGLYYDEGVSGTSMAKRDGLLRLLEDCDTGLIDYIIVKSISRFSRNTVDSIETVRRLCEKGIYIYFEKEKIDTGKMEGELLLSILSSLAESESHSIAENNKWSIQKRYQNGTFKIGYDNVDGKMVINKEQADVVRWIFDELLSGKSTRDIAKELNDAGIHTKRGGRWNSGVISGMVRNEKYKGDVLCQKTYTDDRFNRHDNNGERTQYYYRDHHEAIVSREKHEAANAIIDLNASEKGVRDNTEKYKKRYVYSGKIICGECGGKCKRVKLYGYFGFACQTHVKDKNACGMIAIPEEPIRGAFVTMMNKLTFARDKVLIPYSVMLRQGHTKARIERIDQLDSLLEQNLQRRQQILQFFTKGLLDPVVYQEENDALLKKEEELLEEKKTYTVDADQLKLIQTSVSNYFGVSEKVIQNAAYGDEFSAFYEGEVETFAIQISEVMTRMTFTERERALGAAFFFTANRLQYMTNADKLAVSADLVDRGILSINEAREIWQLPPVDGGDVRVIRGEYYSADDHLTNEEQNDGEE